jgi:hypothetical protein
MADRPRRATQASGASPRIASSWPVASASGAASGSSIATARPLPESATLLATHTTYRTLLTRGLSADEAANLTAFLAGLSIEDTTWTLTQVNRLLFLRELARTGRFDRRDGGARTH